MGRNRSVKRNINNPRTRSRTRLRTRNRNRNRNVKKNDLEIIPEKNVRMPFNCDAEGFTNEMREATLGREYLSYIVNHDNGEQTPYQGLVYISTHGLVGWYCKKAILTPIECTEITSNNNVQILGAFYHRYKVFSEHINRAIESLKKNKELIEGLDFNKKSQYIQDALINVKSYLPDQLNNEKLVMASVTIDSVIEKVQCLLWAIVNKKFPLENLVMDDRIKIRAETPIEINTYDAIYFKDALHRLSFAPAISLLVLSNLINLVIQDDIELSYPPVTFGIY